MTTGIDLRQWPVEQWDQQLVERVDPFDDLAQHAVKELAVDLPLALIDKELRIDGAGVMIGELPLIQRLDDTAPRAAARQVHGLSLGGHGGLSSALQLAQQVDHLERRQRGVRPLVARLGSRAFNGLFD